jgi:hypothetical protein
VSEWLLFSANSAIFQLYDGENKSIFNFQWDDDDEVRFVLDQHSNLDFYSASSLKQQTAGRHVAPLGHIILILNQSVFSRVATNSNFMIFGLTRYD